ncbi:hypothetical protein MKQ70_08875 [Chitinophaga sedimenti]|uniref:hypothetical protein n=1 Tax=Chitinophaga sedimenti TaxID=2033606 RepID=UPI0020031485|nr:hypothetical protein [Chitinophaga sedimenti]MCK7555115.1 hypothetical protein [Chitinophaga sedimenti]
MKKLMLSFLFCSSVATVMAQKAKVSSAEENLGKKDYDKAKADIEAALQHDKTKDDAKTFYVKGKIYEALATQNKSLADALTAYDAYKTAIEKNPKMPDMLMEINGRMFNVYATVGNAGYGNLNSQQWDSAFVNFQKAQEISTFYNSKNMAGNIPTDTSMVFYTGYAAQQAGKKTKHSHS